MPLPHSLSYSARPHAGLRIIWMSFAPAEWTRLML